MCASAGRGIMRYRNERNSNAQGSHSFNAVSGDLKLLSNRQGENVK